MDFLVILTFKIDFFWTNNSFELTQVERLVGYRIITTESPKSIEEIEDSIKYGIRFYLIF